MTADAAYWFLPAVIPIAIYVSWTDMSMMKITNRSTIALFLAFLIIGPFAFGFPDYLFQLIHAPIMLAVGMLFWAARIMGGGDAKMIAAMSPFIVQSDLFLFLMLFAATSMGGVVTHLTFRLTPLHRLVPEWKSWTARSDTLRGGLFGLNMTFPKGLVLSMTLVFYLVLMAIYR